MSNRISVKDKTPSGWTLVDPETGFSEPEEYIVHVKGATAATVAMFDGEKFVPDIYSSTTEFAGDVDFWMPLPEPPEEARQ